MRVLDCDEAAERLVQDFAKRLQATAKRCQANSVATHLVEHDAKLKKLAATAVCVHFVLDNDASSAALSAERMTDVILTASMVRVAAVPTAWTVGHYASRDDTLAFVVALEQLRSFVG